MKAKELRDAGERDAIAGKPIEAFYQLPLKRFTETSRAQYEIGYRAKHKELLKVRRLS